MISTMDSLVIVVLITIIIAIKELGMVITILLITVVELVKTYIFCDPRNNKRSHFKTEGKHSCI